MHASYYNDYKYITLQQYKKLKMGLKIYIH
jgi:hypothetical protein